MMQNLTIILWRDFAEPCDWNLANLYDVEPRALIQAVKRNLERFPDDFMFQLTAAEFHSLRSQIVILEPGRFCWFVE